MSRHFARSVTRFSTLLYRAALLRYPHRLRREYGADMVALFEAMLEDEVERSGWRGLLVGWWRAVRDLVRPHPRPIRPERVENDTMRTEEGTMGTAGRWVLGIGEDMGSAVRSLLREPRFTGLVVGVLGVGIALAVGVFAVVNAYLLRPLPFPGAERLVSVQGAFGDVGWRETGDVFERSVSWDLDVFIVVGDGRAELLRGAWITPDFLDTYAVEPTIGRPFRSGDAGEEGLPVALISHRVWRDRFGEDPGVLGRTFRAFTSDRPEHAETFTIVGVLSPDFWYFNAYTDVLVPLREDRAVYTGRLRPDVPIGRAEEHLTELAASRLDELPPDFRVDLVPLQEQHAATVRPTLVVLQSAVLLVLLIACANAAVLLLVRSGRRSREIGVRRALGAGRARLARQLLTEGLLLAGLAGLVGLLIAWIGLDLLQESVQLRLGRSVPGGPSALRLDPTVLAGALGLSASVGLVFGVVPLLAFAGDNLSAILGSGGRGNTGSAGRLRARSVMVVLQVGLSLTLLSGAGLMIRSALNLHADDLGFAPERVERGSVGLRAASYPEPADRVTFFGQLAERVNALPTVAHAALTTAVPFTNTFEPGELESEWVRGRGAVFTVSSGYFRTMGIPVLRGRDFGPADVTGGPGVAVVSARLAADLWPGEEALGKRVRELRFTMPGATSPEPGPWRTVVGVVADVRRQVGGSPAGDLYLDYRQANPRWMNIVTRRRAGSPPVMPEVDQVVAAMDATVPLAQAQELDEALAVALAPSRFTAALLAVFSTFAMLLAVVGLYGVVAYAARQRRRDVAIRMALGADGTSVTRQFLREGLRVVVAGIALGSVGGLLLSGVIESQLHGVSPRDPWTHGGLALALFLTTVVAVWLPARQAARTAPMGVLRED